MLDPDAPGSSISEPKTAIEKDLLSGSSSPDVCVCAYVSKMFAVSRKDLPEGKKKVLTAEEMRAKAREARAAREQEKERTASEIDGSSTPFSLPTQSEAPRSEPENQPEEQDEELLLGFARLYSGTIRVGDALQCVLPKYNPALEPSHTQNSKYIIDAAVEGLYVMMGKELVPVDSVSAGNIFAIRGLEGRVWRSATLCAPPRNTELLPNEYIVNLGRVNRSVRLTNSAGYPPFDLKYYQVHPIVRVALEPAMPADLPKLLSGLRLLSQSDPCVETFQQQTGEHVIVTAGELHLEVPRFSSTPAPPLTKKCFIAMFEGPP